MTGRKQPAPEASPQTWVTRRLLLFDQNKPRATSKKGEKAAADALDLPRGRRQAFYSDLGKVAEQYHLSMHERAVPSDAAQAAYLRTILKAVLRVQQIVDELPTSSIMYRKYPFWLFGYKPSLDGRDLPNLSEYLKIFIPACEAKIRRLRGQPGARSKEHIAQAAGDLERIWTRYTGKSFPLTVDTDLHHGKLVFISPALQFVFVAMQAFDPKVTLAEVGVGARAARRAQIAEKHSRE